MLFERDSRLERQYRFSQLVKKTDFQVIKKSGEIYKCAALLQKHDCKWKEELSQPNDIFKLHVDTHEKY